MKALALTATMALASTAAAQCDPYENFPLEEVAVLLSQALADGPTEGYSTDPEIAKVQAQLQGLRGFGAEYSTSALLAAAFRDGSFTMADAAAFVQLRTRIFEAWADARRVEDFFWELDGEKPVSPWEVDRMYMEDLRLILRELGPKMHVQARDHLKRIVSIAETSTIPQDVLAELWIYLEDRPNTLESAHAFEKRLDAAEANWEFELYQGPNGFWRQAYKVSGAPDDEMKAFASRADAAGNGDGRLDLEERATMSLLVRMEETFGVKADLFLTDEGRNFARVKDGKFEIHLDRRTPAHEIEGVLAHEYGHVLLARYDKTAGHTRREREAEADYFSGWIHGKLGFRLDDSGYRWTARRWMYSADDPEHGDFHVRVDTVAQGYKDATGKDLFEPPVRQPVTEPGAGVDGPAFDP